MTKNNLSQHWIQRGISYKTNNNCVNRLRPGWCLHQLATSLTRHYNRTKSHGSQYLYYEKIIEFCPLRRTSAFNMRIVKITVKQLDWVPSYGDWVKNV